MNQPRQPDWWSRNWKWFVPVVLLSAVVLVAGFVLAIMSFVSAMMKSSDAYKEALIKAKESPAVLYALGTPITEGYFTSGTIDVSGPSGNAELAIPIYGPRGEATIYVEARKSAGEWSYSALVVQIWATHQRINLLKE